MEQDDFRQLLSTSGQASSSSTHADRHFGRRKQRQRNVLNAESGDISPVGRRTARNKETEKGDDAKRPSRLHKVTDDSTYVDRAEARRQGVGDVNEYAEAEQLHRDFERRIERAQDEEERRTIRAQMGLVGGDERHTILVKGLDFALLEREKAKSRANDADDDALEEAFRNTTSSTSTTKTASEPMEEGTKSKFRPIGVKQTDNIAASSSSSPEYIWRDGKRMRKKRKPNVQNETLHTPLPKKTKKAAKPVNNVANKPKAMSSERAKKENESHDREKEAAKPNHVAPEHPVVQSPILPVKIADAESEDDDDEDIFAGAGRWQGVVEDDENSESE